MSELKTSVVIDLTGNLARQAEKYGQSLSRFSSSGRRGMRLLNQAVDRTGKALDAMGNRYTALLTGAAGVGSAKMVVDLERRFTRLQIQANSTADDMDRLKTLIYDTAQAPDIRIDPSELTSAIEKIVEKTGDLDFAKNNIRNIALAIQAAGASGNDIGAITAEFKKLGIETEQGVLVALDTLVAQGKEGAFTLQNLAAQGERAVSSYSALGYQGQEAIQGMGALLQVARMGTSGPEAAATAYENMLKVIIEKGKELQASGIEVFDPEKLAQGVEAFRPMPGIIKEIIEKSQGRATVLSGLFGSEGYRAITTAAAEFQKQGNFATLDKFLKIQGDGSLLMNDSATAAKDAAGALQNLLTVWKRFADDTLTKPLQNAADLLNSISSETTGKVLQGLIFGGATALVLGKAYKYGSKLSGRSNGIAGSSASIAAGVQPVYVVNMPGGGMGDLLSGKSTGPIKTASKIGNAAKFIGRNAGPLAVAGSVGYGIGTILNDNFIAGTEFGNGIGKFTASALASFGNKEARQALANDPDSGYNRRQRQSYGRVKVEVSDDRVRVKDVTADGMDLDVSGSSMVMQ